MDLKELQEESLKIIRMLRRLKETVDLTIGSSIFDQDINEDNTTDKWRFLSRENLNGEDKFQNEFYYNLH